MTPDQPIPPFHAFIAKASLHENRVEFLKGQYKEKPLDTSHDDFGQHKETDKIIDHFAEHDPTPKKIYTGWVVNQYKKQNIRQEDAPRVKETLGNFEKYKGKLEKKDINQYPHVADLETALQPHLGQVASKKEEKRQVKQEGADVVHDANDTLVHRIKTKEAACAIGRGTRWCTAATQSHNYFDHYNKDGPLYVVHAPDKSKYQLHFETGQFNDAEDRGVGLEKLVGKYPELRNVKEFQGKHPIFDTAETLNQRVASGHKYPRNVDPVAVDAGEKKPRLTSDTLEAHVAHESKGKGNLLSAAQHPNIRPATLTKIWQGAGTNGDTVKGHIAKNPAAEPDLRSHIIENEPKHYPSLASNPSLTGDEVKRLYTKSATGNTKDSTHETLAGHPNVPTEVLHDLAHGTNHIAAGNAVRNPRTSHDTIRSVFASKPPLHAAIAISPAAPDDVLDQLAQSKHDFIRANVAKNRAARAKK